MSTKLTGARPIRAHRPGPGTEELRVAYIDLLKLALSDLVGVGTGSAVDWTWVRWRRESAPEPPGAQWPSEIPEAVAEVAERDRVPLPTEREVRLAAEAEHLRQLLETARQQIALHEAR
jgi:hypothetical protein